MSGVLKIIIFILMGAVLVVLATGIVSMWRGGKHSNLFMRWRVGLQALAIILLVILVFVIKDLSARTRRGLVDSPDGATYVAPAK